MITITFYYNDGSTDQGHISDTKNYTAVECGILRGEFSIALTSTEFFKSHHIIAYKLEDDKGNLLDKKIYVSTSDLNKYYGKILQDLKEDK